VTVTTGDSRGLSGCFVISPIGNSVFCRQDVDPVPHPPWHVTLAEEHVRYSSIVSRTPLRDHRRIVVDGKRHRALESMCPRDEDPETAIERVGGNPRFMRTYSVPAASDDGRLNALAAGTTACPAGAEAATCSRGHAG
jgi:hypothetical protein